MHDAVRESSRCSSSTPQGSGHRFTPGDLALRIAGLGRRCSRLQYEMCVLLAEYDMSGHWAQSGAVTCSRWAADTLEVECSTAREWLRVGHALRELEHVAEAFEDGRLSYAKVRALTRIAVDHPARQEELVELAAGVTAAGLPDELARWTAAEEDESTRDRRHVRETMLTVRTEPDGAAVINVRLPPLAAAAAMAAIDARVARRTSTSATVRDRDASADAPWPRGVRPPRRPSLAWQRAHALVGLLTSGEGSTVVTELLIHLRGDGASLSDGTPIAGHLVERLAPSAFYRALIHDADGRPINASGRQRHPTTRQRRVVAERDGHRCTHDGCDVTCFLHYDHEPPFEESQHTVVDELHLRCGLHHRDRHRGR